MSALVRTTNQLFFQLPVEGSPARSVDVPHHQIDPALTIAHRDAARLETHYRQAAQRLLEANGGGLSHLFITSAHRGDGKTCTALNLSSSLARAGKRVLLAELNFSHPRLLAALGNLRVKYGLENALRGWVEPADAIFCLASAGLDIAPVRNATPADGLQPVLEHLHAFLDWASEYYEMVILDCPAVLSAEWDAWFHRFIGPALLVVREEHTPQVEVRKAMQRLGDHLKGALLNDTRQAPIHEAAPLVKAGFAAQAKSKSSEGPVSIRSALRTGS